MPWPSGSIAIDQDTFICKGWLSSKMIAAVHLTTLWKTPWTFVETLLIFFLRLENGLQGLLCGHGKSNSICEIQPVFRKIHPDLFMP